MISITAEKLKEILSYDPENGVFTWVKAMGPKKAGSIAGGERFDGYWRVGISGVRYRLHALAWLYMTGELPSMAIDHIDGDPSNNKFSNLRHVSNSENQRNRRRQSNNTSGHAGVSVCGRRGVFRAHAKVNGRFKSLGCFKTAEEAAEVARDFRLKNGFTDRHGCADSSCPGRAAVQHLPADDTEGGAL